MINVPPIFALRSVSRSLNVEGMVKTVIAPMVLLRLRNLNLWLTPR